MKKNGLDVLEKPLTRLKKQPFFSPVASFTGDGAYGRDDVYREVFRRHPEAAVIVPSRSNAVPSATAETAPTKRDRHLQLIAERGRMLAAGIWFTIGLPWWRPISAATSE